MRGSLAELAERFREGARGEVTVVVEGCGEVPAAVDAATLDQQIRERLAAGESVKQIAAALALPGLPRRTVYARTVALREGGGDELPS